MKTIPKTSEKRAAARILLMSGMPIRQVERITGLAYITCYRIANAGTAH